MKTLIVIFLISFSAGAFGQEIKKGEAVYLQNDSENENATEVATVLLNKLNEWGYWKITDNQNEAAAIMKLDVEASKGITATSFGGTSIACSVTLTSKDGKVLWESDTYKSSPNGSNGFNAKKTAANKLARAIEKKYGKN